MGQTTKPKIYKAIAIVVCIAIWIPAGIAFFKYCSTIPELALYLGVITGYAFGLQSFYIIETIYKKNRKGTIKNGLTLAAMAAGFMIFIALPTAFNFKISNWYIIISIAIVFAQMLANVKFRH